MIFNTFWRFQNLICGKHELASRLVLSRKDVSSAFRDLRRKTVDEVCHYINSIRVQPFLEEYDEWKELEKTNSLENIWSQRNVDEDQVERLPTLDLTVTQTVCFGLV